MFIDFMLDGFKENYDKDAIIWNENTYNYEWLLDRINHWQDAIKDVAIEPGTITVLEADFSPNSIALFLALIETGCVLVPLTSTIASKRNEYIETVEGEVSLILGDDDNITINKRFCEADHELYRKLRSSGHPGLVLFSSGSTGKSKAAVHDFVPMLQKYYVKRHSLRTITFLLYDHIGGVNTMLYTLSNAGCIITVQDRRPDAVFKAIERHRAELLPTSPTFINLILMSEAYKYYSADSLKVVTYGTEPMPESTLKRFHEIFPHVKLQQTYGLSEVGILRSKSRSSDSLWVKIGGEGFETRIIDGILHIKAESAMMGYLNAPSPFTEDGWFNTGDYVEVNGEDKDYVRILGRKTDLINVGGEKVFPAEVESVIQEMDNIVEATVYGEKNPLVGNIVCAKVKLAEKEDIKQLTLRLKKYCKTKLENYKVPVKVYTVDDMEHHTARFKKVR